MIGTISLSLLANKIGGKLVGSDAKFSQISTDSRTIDSGALYLALSGPNFDGNDFVDSAKRAGACAAIVSRISNLDFPMLQVEDTHAALGYLAALNRSRSTAKLIGLTGSQGKTTVKEMLGFILSQAAETLITKDNLNNTIGVPKTLLQLTAEHRYAVVEMGADRAGEVGFSASIATPDIGLITNANAAHIEGFGSLQGIVNAKGELIDGVTADGVVVLNADDQHVSDWIERAGERKVVLFSLEEKGVKADYYAQDMNLEEKGQVAFTLVTPIGEIAISMQLFGKHNIMNAVAAAAAAVEAGASLSNVQRGLNLVKPIPGRLYPQAGVNDSLLIDDSYNASPSSFFAAIDVLMSFSGNRVLVAGDMKELGEESEQSHSSVGEYAAKAGVENLWTVGEQSRLTAQAFGAKAIHFESMDELIAHCNQQASADSVFLIKGSRGAKMELVVNALRASEEI